MKAARFHHKGDIRVEDVDEPRCGKGQIKLKPAYVGICGTDIHEYTAGPVLIPQKPHPITGASHPVALGHEISGVVEEVGEGVTHLQPGQRAAVRPTIFDENCAACQQGARHCCENIGFIGISGYGGGMSEHLVAPSTHFYALPPNISLQTAALIEPLAVAWHAVSLSPFKRNDSTVVIGGGPIGISVIQILRLQGASKIMLVEPMATRQELARSYGATEILDPGSESDIAGKVKTLTRRVGADVIFDTAGVEVALNGIIPACRTHGAIINIAVWEKGPALDVNELMYNEVQYMGAALYDEVSFKEVIKAISEGKLDPDPMITGRIRLEDVVEKGFEDLIQHRDRHCKLLVEVQA